MEKSVCGRSEKNRGRHKKASEVSGVEFRGSAVVTTEMAD
jgi:hypothetical protein